MLLELRRITKRFPGVIANDSLDLSLHSGEVHILIGENGAGKSTVVGLLGGLLQPDAGEIWLNDALAKIETPHRARELGISVVRQHPNLVPGLTVVENLLLGRRWLARPDRREASARFTVDCASFGMTIDPARLAGHLSFGEQQQIEIIRASWSGCRVLILDEPTAMQTSIGVKSLMLILRKLVSAGTAIVFVTHKLDEALEVGDRVTVLRHGHVAGKLSPWELRAEQPDALKARMVELMFGASASRHPGTPEKSARHVPKRKVLQVSGLAVVSDRAEPALTDINVELHAGEIVGVAGIDGNGQTALAEAIAGQLVPISGEIIFDGANIRSRTIAQLHQAGLRYISDDRLNEGIIASFSVAINLVAKRIGSPLFWAWGMTKRSALAAHARRLIETYNVVTTSPWQPAGTLSGGNIQKLILARELDGVVKLLICNKPTHGLDLNTALSIHDRILRRATEGAAILLISSDVEELLALSDRVGIMSGGRIVGMAPNDALARQSIHAHMIGEPAA